jgi:cobalt-zinc-cadmium efflux system membrane fusion protein
MPINRGPVAFFPVIILVLGSCSQPDNPVLKSPDSTRQFESVQLTPRDIRREGIAFESIIKQEVPRYVPCTGHLVAAPEHRISIPSPAAGRITAIHYRFGHFIKAGTRIALLENIDFVKLQQEYLESLNQFDFYKEEFARQGELTVENATSMKKMQIARRDYQSAEVSLRTLRSQLENLGICPDSVRIEKLTPAIPIIADGSGYLSGIEISTGTYVDKGEPLFELVNNQTLSLKLQVQEQYIGSLKPGLNVDFHLSFDSLTLNNAKLTSVIREIDPIEHTATVYAEFSCRNEIFIPGMSVKARIEAGYDTIWMTPSRSILHQSTGNFIFIKKDGEYLKIPIQQGITHEGKTEIIGLPYQMADSVVISGVEYLGALLKNQ